MSSTAFDDQWAIEPLSNGDFKVIRPEEHNLKMIVEGTEMLRVARDGFYVRGKKVPVDDKEAETVYNAFKQFLTWAELNRR
jgi:hypothetical protein